MIKWLQELIKESKDVRTFVNKLMFYFKEDLASEESTLQESIKTAMQPYYPLAPGKVFLPFPKGTYFWAADITQEGTNAPISSSILTTLTQDPASIYNDVGDYTISFDNIPELQGGYTAMILSGTFATASDRDSTANFILYKLDGLNLRIFSLAEISVNEDGILADGSTEPVIIAFLPPPA